MRRVAARRRVLVGRRGFLVLACSLVASLVTGRLGGGLQRPAAGERPVEREAMFYRRLGES